MFARALKAFARNPKPRRRPVVEGMEPRVLFSADGLSSLLLPAQGDGATMDAALERIIDLAPVIPIITPADIAPATVDSAVRHEVVVVDSRVADYEQLVDSIHQRGSHAVDIEIIVINQLDIGFSRIGELLAQRHDVSALHILSHGREGSVQLGAEWIDVQALRQQAGALAQWQQALTENGDILIYGCDVARGSAGQVFIEELARLTRADVAASSDLTGNSAFGGNWVLETKIGAIEHHDALSDAEISKWSGVLGGAQGDGAAIWTTSGDTTPNISAWDGTSFGGATNTAGVGAWRVIDGAEAPTRDEKIVVGVDAAGNISGQMWNGTAWASLGNLASGTTADRHGFDVAYESHTGNALMVWNNGTTGTASVSYSVWNGTTWSAKQDITVPISGLAQQLYLAANPNSLSNEMVLLVCDDSSNDYALVWNGSSWGNDIALGTLTPKDTSLDSSLAYDSQTGHALVVYDNISGGDSLNYRTWNGTAWSVEKILSPPAGISNDPTVVVLTADPNSRNIALGVLNKNKEIWLSLWDGTSWTNSVIATTAAVSNAIPAFSAAFESQSGDLLVTYAEASNQVRYRTWSSSLGVWSAQLNGPDIGAGQTPNVMDLRSNPYSDAITLAVQDSASNLNYAQWSGIDWGFPPYQLEANTGETATQPFFFVYEDVNSAPFGADKTIAILEDAVYTFSTGDFGFSDPDDTPVNTLAGVRISTLPSAGTLTTNGTTVVAGQTITAADIAGGLFKFAPAPDANGAGYASFTFQVQDNGNPSNGGLTFDQVPNTMTFDVTAVNDAPVATVPGAAYSATEQTTLTLKSTGLSVSDADAGTNNVTVTLSVGEGTLSAGAGGSGAVVVGSGTGTLTFTGTVAQINALLNTDGTSTLSYIDNTDTPSAITTLTLKIDDQGNTGSGGALNNSKNVTINLTAVNDAPVATVPGAAYSATEQTTLTLKSTGLSVSDADAGTNNVTVTLSVGEGTLSAGAGGSGAVVVGSGTGTLTFTGTVAQINALLNTDGTSTLSYIDNTDTPSASTTLTLKIDDQGNTGSGGALNNSKNVTINLTAVNDAPVATVPGAAYSATEQTTLTLKSTGLSVSDADAGTNNVTVTLSAGEGTLSAGAGGSGAVVVGSGTGTLTFTGTVAQINALLNTDGTSTLSYIDNTDTPSAITTLTLKIDDQGNTGSGGALNNSKNVTINLTAVNDAPVATVPGAAYSATEQTTLTLKSTGLSVSDADAGTNNVTVTLSVGEGTLSAGAGGSGAVVVGSGTGTLTFTGTVAQINALLNTDGTSTLSYIDNTDTPSASTTLTLKIDDQGNTGSGGALNNSKNVTIDLTAVNDAPVNTVPFARTMDEDTSLDFTGANTISIADVDLGGGTATTQLTVSKGTLNVTLSGAASISAGANGSTTLTLSGTQPDLNNTLASLQYKGNADYNGADSLQIITNDGGNSGSGGAKNDTDTITITVTSVNDAPSGADKTITTLEDTAYTFTAADFGFSDPIDAANSSGANALANVKISTLPIAGALTNNGIALNANDSVTVADINAGKLKFTPVADANKAGYASFTFQVQDNGGVANGGIDLDPSANTITIDVTSVNDAPSGADKTITTLEDTAYTFTAADFGFSDPIDAANSSGANALANVKISTLPIAGALTNNGIALNANDSVTVADINAGKLKFTPVADANKAGYASFTFQVQDNGGVANGGIDLDPSANTITIDVTSVNDAPSGADKTITTLEDTAYTFTAADFGFSDPIDAANSSGANALANVKISTLPIAGALTNNGIALNANDSVTVADINAGKLKFTPVADANKAGYASFTFQVQDNGGVANGGIDLDPSANTITIDVTSVNDAPSGADKTITTLEDTAYTFTAADFGFSDPIDAANSSGANALANVKISTLPIAGALTNNGIALNANDSVTVADINAGKLKFTPVADANKAGYASFTFQVQDNGGVANGGIDLDPSANTITIDVTSVNDAPSGADKTITTLEDTAYTFTAADFGFSDPIDAANSSGANALANVKISTLPIAGALTNNGIALNANDSVTVADINAGKLKFTPVADANKAGYASFTFQVQDNGGVANGGIDLDPSANTITIDVTSVNDAPSGADKTITTLEDTAYTFTAADFGFSDPIDAANSSGANALANVKISTLPIAGALTNNGIALNANDSVTVADINAGKLKFTPVADANKAGYASFTFQVQDNGGVANGGIDLDPSANTITIDVTSVNDAPSGADKTITTLEDTAYTFTAADFGFSDPIDAANSSGANALANVKISTLPIAGALTNNGIALNANDSVTVADINAGKLKFTPVADANKAGYASFTFQVQDNGGVANGGIDLDPSANTITIDVTSVNDAPSGADKTITTLEDTAYTFTAADFGFSDPIDAANSSGANALANVKISTLPIAGALTNNGIALNANDSVTVADINAGKLKFTPVADANKAGYASFTFQVQDNGGVANGGIDLDPSANTITIDVTSVNDAPSGADKTITTLEDTAYTFTAADFGFSDPIDAANSSGANALANVKISTLPIAGALTNNGIALNANDSVTVADINAGKLKFTPVADANKAGYASFTFQVQDNGGVANGGIDLDPSANTITIDVTSVNDAPSGADKTITTLEDTAYTFTAADFGFSDPIDAANSSGANALANVKISTLPIAGALTNNGIALNANDSVTVADINAGKLKFTPVADANKAGYASFTFQVQDNGGVANGGIDLDPSANTITIDVTSVNDAPSGADKTITTLEDTAYTFTAADFGFSDPIDAANSSGANALANVKISTLPIAGALTNNGIALNANDSVTVADINAGKLKFTPVADANKAGYASFTFQVQDNGGVANGGIDLDPSANTITIDVTAVNDPALIGGTTRGTVIEAGGVANGSTNTPVASGTLTAADVDNPANTFTAVGALTAGANGYGSYTLSAGGVWTYTLDNNNAAVQALNAGQQLTDTFTVQTVDGTPQLISISIDGRNDNAIISGTTSGTVIEAGGVSNGSTNAPVASGTLTNTDVDNPDNVFTVQNAVATLHGRFQIDAVGRWTYNVNNSDSAVEALNVGDTLNDSFIVASQDGTAQTVTITIGGTNDNAVITNITTGVVTEAGGVSGAAPAVSTLTGVLLAADKDNPSNVFLPVAAGTARYGTFDLKVNGAWVYTLDNTNPAVEALGNGGKLTDQFTVASVDGTTQVVVISIQGTLDIKPGGSNPGPAITLGAELVDSSVNEVRNFESRGTAALPSTTQDKSGGRGLLIAEPIIAIGDTLGSLDFDDGGQRSNSRDQRGVLSGAGSGFLLRLGLASRLRDYSLDFGAYEFGDYRFQMGRISFAQQMTGRGLGIGGGDTSVTSSTGGGGEEQVMSAAAATKVVGLSATLGVAAWALRSGGLLAAMLSSMPAWRQMDLLPIFSGSDNNKQGMGSTDTESTREERAVDQILGGGTGGGTGGGAHGASRGG